MAFNNTNACWRFGDPNNGCTFGKYCRFNHDNKDASIAAFNAKINHDKSPLLKLCDQTTPRYTLNIIAICIMIIYVCLCIFICICVYMYVYVYICVCICVCIYIYIYIYMYVYIPLFIKNNNIKNNNIKNNNIKY